MIALAPKLNFYTLWRKSASVSKLKSQAHELVENHPENAILDDLMYANYVRQSIDAGLQDADEGRLHSVEEVRARFGLEPLKSAGQIRLLLFPRSSVTAIKLKVGWFPSPALLVIYKWLKPVIPAWTAGIQSQGGESAGWCAY